MRRHKRVLLVEDNEPLARALARGLSVSGLEVVVAQNGQEALRMFAQEPPDIVVTDIEMPVMDGIELLKTLRRLSPGIRVIAVSGSDRLAQAEKEGAIAVFRKPVRGAILREAVWALLESDDRREPLERPNSSFS